MIFAHGPLGALAARAAFSPVKRKQPFTRAQFVAILTVGFIGGIFPDVDLFYTSFIDGSAPHRALLTHTAPIYLAIWIVGFFLLTLAKKRFARMLWTVFFLGVLTHLITDMIAAEVRFLYPFLPQYFGLIDIGISDINENLLFINFAIEGFIIAVFLIMLIAEFVPLEKQRPLGLFVGLLTAVGILMLVYGNMHIYKGPHIGHYEDRDQDGISNYADLDMDGDGVENFHDTDSDGDGLENIIEVLDAAESFDRVWIDPTNAGFIRIPQRMGFVNTQDIPWRTYRAAGIFFESSMPESYERNNEGYVSAPTDENFIYETQNIQAWLSNEGRLDTGLALTEKPTRLGDILFANDGTMYVVSGFDEGGGPKVVDAIKTRWYGGSVRIESIDAVLTRHNQTIIARGTPLYSAESVQQE